MRAPLNLLQAVVLGIVQGLTEFLPVSSTAHLILVEHALQWQFDRDVRSAFNILVQLGTTVALIVYFWRDLWQIARGFIAGLLHRHPLETDDARLGWLLVLATLPAVFIGLAVKPLFDALQEQPVVVAVVLIVASLLLLLGERIGRRTRFLLSATGLDAIVVGFAQALALLPGVSRSGATISAALARDFERTAAARLSFLMSVPALLGASALATRDLLKVPNLSAVLPPIGIGFVVAAIVGYVTIRWLLHFLANHPLHVFAAYRVLAGVLFLAILALLG